jgi:Domain of unknown function (DUF4173)
MNDKQKVSAILFFTALFTIVFYQQSAGINVLIFESIYLLFVATFARQALKRPLAWLFFGGTLLTAVFTVVTNSVFVILFNFISLMMLSGILIFPEAVSVISVAGLAFYNLLLAQVNSLKKVVDHKSRLNPFRKILFYARIVLIPLIVIFFFVVIYKAANPVFNGYANEAWLRFGHYLSAFFNRIDFWLVTTIVLGYLLSNVLILQNSVAEVIAYDGRNDGLIRMKNPNYSYTHYRTTALKNEFRAAIFLFSGLNIILLFVNLIDINWVWLNFEWTGQYLKQFVHEGTWLLIASIIVSMVLVLFFFRGNLNFFTKNKPLKYLCYAWLIQNCILVISVGIRNIYYIQHFALAYKRIGVLVFLLMTLIGLVTIIHKIHSRKSSFHTTRVNALSLYVVLLALSLFNWDNIIARYNFNHYQTAFVHLDFLAELSDKALPELQKTDAELAALSKSQEAVFHFDYKYMKPDQYAAIIDSRVATFKNKWEVKSWLSWNYAEQVAYDRLKK